MTRSETLAAYARILHELAAVADDLSKHDKHKGEQATIERRALSDTRYHLQQAQFARKKRDG